MALPFYSAQDGHYVPLVAPGSIAGGATAPAFALKQYHHVSILIALGAVPAAPEAIVLNACTNQAGAGATPVAYDLFASTGSGLDTLTTRQPQTAAGYVPAATADMFYVIEFSASALPQGYPYLQVVLNNTAGNAVIASAFAILSAARYEQDQSPTVLV